MLLELRHETYIKDFNTMLHLRYNSRARKASRKSENPENWNN